MTKKATYSYKNVMECIEKIKTINSTVRTKKEHFPKLLEIKKVFDFCYEKTGCLLFETKYSDFSDYSKLVNMDIEHKKATKKDMDKALKKCIRFLQYEIKNIYEAMQKEEVNAVA